VPWRARSALLAVLAVVASGCGLVDHAGNRGATEQGRDIFDLWRAEMIVALVVGTLVWALIGWSVLRYRRRSDALPTQRQYVLPLEIAYTALPVVAVAVIFGFSYVTQRNVDELSADPDVVIEVQGFQWQWQFRYEGSDVVVTGLPGDPPVMVVPVDRTVRLRLMSRDVIHSFYVPDFLAKRDAIPGVDNEIDVDVLEAGRYSGVCAEFCGLDHAKMTFVVEAVSPAEFDAWLTDQADDQTGDQTDNATRVDGADGS